MVVIHPGAGRPGQMAQRYGPGSWIEQVRVDIELGLPGQGHRSEGLAHLEVADPPPPTPPYAFRISENLRYIIAARRGCQLIIR
jgi:hypothetical protein